MPRTEPNDSHFAPQRSVYYITTILSNYKTEHISWKKNNFLFLKEISFQFFTLFKKEICIAGISSMYIAEYKLQDCLFCVGAAPELDQDLL